MKIGFIAMSGVRANNEELTRLGLTLPGFIERNKTIASLPSLGLLTLAGMTPTDIDVEYIELPELLEIEYLPGDFDVVAISSFTAKIKDAYELAERYRNVGTKVILGGLHVTAKPDEASRHADSIVLGEAELVWQDLIADLQRDKLKRVYDARGRSFNLANAPMPAFELLNPEIYNRLTVQTQRGCPFSCEFCAASIRLSPAYKVKPVNKVISEIRKIKEIWNLPFIEFADDNSFANKKHAKLLLNSLIAEDIRWFTESDIAIAEDDELLSLMRDSGCAQVLIGFESPVRNGLSGIEMKGNWKAKQFDKYKKSIEKIQSHGITVNGCFILGLDGTGLESFDNVFEFVKDSGLYEVQVTIQTAFPGTPLYERLKDTGRLIKEDAWEMCTLFDVNFEPENMTVSELEMNFTQLVQKLYSDEFTKERRQRYKEQLRNVVKNQHQQRRNIDEHKVA
jgi:radical SAM superfamily enzyme YgiQ (UPF0313 family)